MPSSTDGFRPATHVVGLMHPAIDSRDLQRLRRLEFYFGPVDVIHYRWDYRAREEIVPGDLAIFATGTDQDPVDSHSFDDSDRQ